MFTSRSNSGSAIESTWLTWPGEVEHDLGVRERPRRTASASPRSASTTVIGTAAPFEVVGFAPWRGTSASTTVTSAPPPAQRQREVGADEAEAAGHEAPATGERFGNQKHNSTQGAQIRADARTSSPTHNHNDSGSFSVSSTSTSTALSRSSGPRYSSSARDGRAPARVARQLVFDRHPEDRIIDVVEHVEVGRANGEPPGRANGRRTGMFEPGPHRPTRGRELVVRVERGYQARRTPGGGVDEDPQRDRFDGRAGGGRDRRAPLGPATSDAAAPRRECHDVAVAGDAFDLQGLAPQHPRTGNTGFRDVVGGDVLEVPRDCVEAESTRGGDVGETNPAFGPEDAGRLGRWRGTEGRARGGAQSSSPRTCSGGRVINARSPRNTTGRCISSGCSSSNSITASRVS